MNVWKKSILLAVLCSLIVLTGCSLEDLKQRFADFTSELVQKDQQQEQWFVVTSEMIDDKFDKSIGYINMRSMGLTSIPDFCGMVKAEDHELVTNINLSNNAIRVLDQDLSCLTNLKKLNLSYNEIQVVASLGELPALQELLLHKNEIKTTENFPNYPALQKLTLGYNKLKEVVDISHLKNLVNLELQHNQISKIIGAENLEKLEQLKVEFNKLKELNFIEKLENLEVVSAKGNMIKDALVEELEKLNKKFRSVTGGSVSGEADAEVNVVVVE